MIHHLENLKNEIQNYKCSKISTMKKNRSRKRLKGMEISACELIFPLRDETRVIFLLPFIFFPSSQFFFFFNNQGENITKRKIISLPTLM